MDKREILKHIGSIEQIGGIKSFTYNEGKARGCRAVEVNTGVLRFEILPDRCMDIGQAYYRENALSWISKTGITAPSYCGSGVDRLAIYSAVMASAWRFGYGHMSDMSNAVAEEQRERRSA